MPTQLSFDPGSATTATFTSLNSLASSATVGAQTAAIDLRDGNGNLPLYVHFLLTVEGAGSGTVGNDKCVYLWLPGSPDGTNYEYGPPVLGSSDAGYTFTTAPGTTAPPWLSSATPQFPSNSAKETVRFTLYDPMPYVVAVALNYSGIALKSSGNSLIYLPVYGDAR